MNNTTRRALENYAEAYADEHWDPDHMGEPDREAFMEAVKDWAEWIDGAVGDRWPEWAEKYMAGRHGAAIDAAVDRAGLLSRPS